MQQKPQNCDTETSTSTTNKKRGKAWSAPSIYKQNEKWRGRSSTRRRRWCFQIALQVLWNPRKKLHKISSQQKLYQNCSRNCYTLPQFFYAQPKANKRRATGERERERQREERERAMLHNLLTALVLIPNLFPNLQRQGRTYFRAYL